EMTTQTSKQANTKQNNTSTCMIRNPNSEAGARTTNRSAIRSLADPNMLKRRSSSSIGEPGAWGASVRAFTMRVLFSMRARQP
ncbi:MAG: hypothetical protein V4710_05555, partial [Verrucomicrobiota bacterium]